MENPSLSGRGSAGAKDVPRLAHAGRLTFGSGAAVSDQPSGGTTWTDAGRPRTTWARSDARSSTTRRRARCRAWACGRGLELGPARGVRRRGPQPGLFLQREDHVRARRGPCRYRPAEPGGKVRALAALRRFKLLAEGMGAAPLTVVATAAVREAEDGPAFREEIERETGLGSGSSTATKRRGCRRRASCWAGPAPMAWSATSAARRWNWPSSAAAACGPPRDLAAGAVPAGRDRRRAEGAEGPCRRDPGGAPHRDGRAARPAFSSWAAPGAPSPGWTCFGATTRSRSCTNTG
jgi:hypothetical protein